MVVVMKIEIVNSGNVALIQEVIRVHNLAFSNRETKGKKNPYTPINEEEFLKMLNNSNAYMYAMVQDDSVQGAVCCTYENENGNKICGISHVCVNPEQQRKGIARRLLNYAEEQAIQSNCQMMRLNVGSIWEPAVNLYTSLGFLKHGIVAHVPGTYYLIRMVKILAPYSVPVWKQKATFLYSRIKFAVLFHKDSTPNTLHRIIYKK